MSTTSTPLPAARPPSRGPSRAVQAFVTGITAVGTKELRGRMRGRRAFAVVTVYLLLLSAFAFGIYAYLRQQAQLQADGVFGADVIERPAVVGLFNGSGGMALSADIGHAIFSGLLLVLTLLVLVLAPAFTTGAISLEREKQTIDLLVTTPLSTLGMVIGKLFSALTYVFLLILASVPLMAIVFVFGGVGPEDLARAYLVLFATAFGMGAIGLFISAITRRTQTATVLSLIVVLGLTIGTATVHELWRVLSTETARTQSGFIPVSRSDRAPEALLWLNPFVADLDLMCTTAPGGYQRDTCDYVASVTGTPFFGGSRNRTEPAFGMDDQAVDNLLARQKEQDAREQEALAQDGPGVAVAFAVVIPPDARPGPIADQQALPSFGFPRDTFWPQTVVAFVVLGVVLTLLSAQLVSPTRRLRILRPGRRAPAVDAAVWGTAPAVVTSEPEPVADGASPRDPSAQPAPTTDEVTP